MLNSILGEGYCVSTAPVPTHLGFLTVVRDNGGYVGGYLVTNLWGRPLEFRLSTVVQPNRVQQIIYGPTLAGYLCSDLIGKALVEKTSTPVQAVLTDNRDVLDLRRNLDVPVGWIGSSHGERSPAATTRFTLQPHPEYSDDGPRLNELSEQIGCLDVAEPFSRIRDALSEARKMGVTHRG